MLIEQVRELTRTSACLLLVHPDIRRLDAAVAELAAETGWPLLSVGRLLSETLLQEPMRLRPRAARLGLADLLEVHAPGTVVCTEIDLLFEPSLELDPLAAFRGASRTTRLVVAWPGSYSGGVLSYAVPEHAHFKTWRNPDAAILVLP